MSILFLVTGFFLGRTGWISPSTAHEIRGGGYKFINPLLECESTEVAFIELRPFRDRLGSYVENIVRENNRVDSLAIYFRDLNNGPWFGVNQDITFSPASLLKVPLAIVYFKSAERDPAILEESYVFKNDNLFPMAEQTIKPSQVLEVGKSYSVHDLIRRMLVYSDNDAHNLLVMHVNLKILKEVYDDFSLPLPTQENPGEFVSVRDYARFFRILFNSSYLSKEHSEEMLSLLSQVEYKDGLVAGVPADVMVAHKFGERQQYGGSSRQLHDCGVVYFPGNPYLLCVMTRGSDNSQLSGAIKDISRLVYEEVGKQLELR